MISMILFFSPRQIPYNGPHTDLHEFLVWVHGFVAIDSSNQILVFLKNNQWKILPRDNHRQV